MSKPNAAGPDADVLARYTGTYDNHQGVALGIALNKPGMLKVTLLGRPEVALLWLEGARFRVWQTDIFLEFTGSPDVTDVEMMGIGSVSHLQRMR